MVSFQVMTLSPEITKNRLDVYISVSSHGQEESNIPVVVMYVGALPGYQMNRVVEVTSIQIFT